MNRLFWFGLVSLGVAVAAAAAIAALSTDRGPWNILGTGRFRSLVPDMMMSGDRWAGASVEPLSLEAARSAVESYAASLGDGFEVGEVMIFDNHAYAQILESSTGVGAMEVLVDPATLTVYPEHGPNRMWNLKYGHMAAHGMGRMMGRFSTGGWGFQAGSADISTTMTVTPERAVTLAQRYLDAFQPGTTADDHADAFYGYYTLHTLRDGEIIGMLSVNGFSGSVFLHTWHGSFIEMSADH